MGLPMYFVTKDQNQFAVIGEAFDEDAGNYYHNVASGFATQEKAQKHADELNAKQQNQEFIGR